jgi:hypothetical protein
VERAVGTDGPQTGLAAWPQQSSGVGLALLCTAWCCSCSGAGAAVWGPVGRAVKQLLGGDALCTWLLQAWCDGVCLGGSTKELSAGRVWGGWCRMKAHVPCFVSGGKHSCRQASAGYMYNKSMLHWLARGLVAGCKQEGNSSRAPRQKDCRWVWYHHVTCMGGSADPVVVGCVPTPWGCRWPAAAWTG